MLDTLKEYIVAFFNSRLLPVGVIFILLLSILVNRMFELQIVDSEDYNAQTAKLDEKVREISASRGNMYDCNGKLLAYNKLSYNVIYSSDENSSKLTSEQKNAMIYYLLQLLEENDCSLSLEFYIEFDNKGRANFTVSGNALLRFKAEAFGTTVAKLNQEQRDMTAQEVYDFLRSDNGSKSPKFLIDEKYDRDTTLKIMAVRYAMFINRYHSYQNIILASDVNDKTVAAIKENNTELPGIDIDEDTTRVYNNSKYFAHILGYTGAVTTERLEELKEKEPNTPYSISDQIGITGVESSFEEYLCGTKGSEVLTINENTGRIEKTANKVDPVSGNDVWLTIDSKLQIECYHLLEEHIAGVLIANINNSESAGSKGQSASKIKVPIYDVYSALIENNIIDSTKFTEKTSSSLEKQTYKKYKNKSKEIKSQLKKLLAVDSKVTEKDVSDSMADFLDYFYKVLKDERVVLVDDVDTEDPTFLKYTSDKISLSEYLQYAITKNWVDLSVLNIGDNYFSAEEIYKKLLNYGMDLLENDVTYPKMVYSYLIHNMELSGRDCCLLLFDQGDIKYNAEEYESLERGLTSPYSFIIKKIKALEITPGDLGLEPCSGSLIVTDV
ncbi:MAG: hypothetical protein IJ733_15575, partial [Lachnospiraceae bacterium]|nr:hypothetical protein [Lachnospiraceae bacterium]